MLLRKPNIFQGKSEKIIAKELHKAVKIQSGLGDKYLGNEA